MIWNLIIFDSLDVCVGKCVTVLSSGTDELTYKVWAVQNRIQEAHDNAHQKHRRASTIF